MVPKDTPKDTGVLADVLVAANRNLILGLGEWIKPSPLRPEIRLRHGLCHHGGEWVQARPRDHVARERLAGQWVLEGCGQRGEVTGTHWIGQWKGARHQGLSRLPDALVGKEEERLVFSLIQLWQDHRSADVGAELVIPQCGLLGGRKAPCVEFIVAQRVISRSVDGISAALGRDVDD